MGNCASGMKKCFDRDGDGDVDLDDFRILLGEVGNTIGQLSALAQAAATAAVVVNPELGKTDAYTKFQEAMGIINASNTLIQEMANRDSKFSALFTRLANELKDLKEVKDPASAITNFQEATLALNEFTQYIAAHKQLEKMFGPNFSKFQKVAADAQTFLDAFLEGNKEARLAMAREAGANHARGIGTSPVVASTTHHMRTDADADLERVVVGLGDTDASATATAAPHRQLPRVPSPSPSS